MGHHRYQNAARPLLLNHVDKTALPSVADAVDDEVIEYPEQQIPIPHKGYILMLEKQAQLHTRLIHHQFRLVLNLHQKPFDA